MKKVLIIDDEKDFCFFVKKGLEKVGKFSVAVCSNAKESFKEITRFQPDLILLDILMPEINGSQLAIELKKNKETQNIPFIFVTALISYDEIEKAGLNPHDHKILTKPVRLSELVTVINSAIS
ncbi:MAG: response regulator [Candidatus Omnitrophica bacterium]|nr:response regulator [Candidatus Omnitrophota bacterium]